MSRADPEMHPSRNEPFIQVGSEVIATSPSGLCVGVYVCGCGLYAVKARMFIFRISWASANFYFACCYFGFCFLLLSKTCMTCSCPLVVERSILLADKNLRGVPFLVVADSVWFFCELHARMHVCVTWIQGLPWLGFMSGTTSVFLPFSQAKSLWERQESDRHVKCPFSSACCCF